jgi:hypothetical protein
MISCGLTAERKSAVQINTAEEAWSAWPEQQIAHQRGPMVRSRGLMEMVSDAAPPAAMRFSSASLN